MLVAAWCIIEFSLVAAVAAVSPPRRALRSKADPNEPRHFNKKDDDAMLVLFKVGARSSARVGAVMRGRHHARGC